MFVTLFSLFAAASLVSATVNVETPLDGQLPTVARVGQKYSWAMSEKTFTTDLDQILVYEPSGMPAWLNFDNITQTFYGTPAATDEGTPQVTITADDTESSVSSNVIFCVTPYPAPTLQKPLSQQFYAGNTALSSVFSLAPGSALVTENPTLRVPLKWSFSIGIDSDTYTAPNELYYAALLSDGTPLPSWITFDASTVTFDGVAPRADQIETPLTLEIEVHASDQKGYSAGYVPFSLVVASDELSTLTSLPTANITAGTPFNVTMHSPADFSGVLVDGQPIQPANVSGLSVDVSSYKNWLKYDAESNTLYGLPPDNFTAADGRPVLPVTLTSNFNQTLYTSMSLDIVASYFSEADLGTLHADPGQQVQFNLAQFFASPSGQHSNADLSTSYYPASASSFLIFNSTTAQLTGRIPPEFNVPKVQVTFVAYSPITHSTSHATLSVVSPELERVAGNGIGGVAPVSKSRVTLIVALVFGIIGGLFLLGFALALFRRCARVKDSAVLGEEGTRAWTEEEKRWYGIGIQVNDGKRRERGYGWNKEADTSATSEKGSLETQVKENPFDPSLYPQNSAYENLGLGLRRVSPHAPNTPSTVNAASCADGVMKKAEFFGRIRDTARNVSDKYKRRPPPTRPVISNPVLLASRRPMVEGLPIEGQYIEIGRTSPNMESTTTSINDVRLAAEKRTSTLASFTTSPSNSTGERSIPRRRADFAPARSPRGPRVPVPAAVKDSSRRSLVRESMKSTQSASAASAESHADTVQTGEDRPRLKQFTHASRVPPPRSPSSIAAEPAVSSGARRVASQTAKVYKDSHEGRHASIDELRIGMHYVRTLGEGPSNVRSASDKSFSSLESSQHGHGAAGHEKESTSSRFLVRTGEKFKFRVPMGASSNQYRKLEARLISGHALPPFMQVELKGYGGKGDEKKAVEFYGVPADVDIGELHVGIFNVEGGECLARVVVEVVARNKRSPPLAG
ncbi:hypothetical protein HYDPIDRAFT_27875 [Hydnomerulius pinastri MD-312]|uniref:Dystroglycan-type cadherin-like domain-containing protein n=1 Tax=Hydnomerulius pinastri MD-312 TaxID=994086 RepID=A0A0C9WAX0_9AGAM|nr:hypothetical protein HYDPIDRAFT_27875 [Hydnomerulius pinastri MD-312]